MIIKSCFILGLITMWLGTTEAQPALLDNTFGDNGIVITDIFESHETFTTMAIQPDQKILAAGYISPSSSVGIFDFVLTRYLPNGSLDADFGENGKVRINIKGSDDRCYAIAIQPDGRILVGGLTTYQSVITFDIVRDFALVRLNEDGNLDSTFGTAGILVTDLGGEEEVVNEILIQPDGKIIAAGKYSNLDTASFAMIRYESDGTIDAGFGTNGIVITSIYDWNYANSGAIQPDGKILLSGYAGTDSTADFAIVRYKTDGTLDSIFGENGIVVTDFPGMDRTDYAMSLLLEPDGKIVIGGYSNINFEIIVSQIAIARYNSEGNLDGNFGQNGLLLLALGTESEIFSIVRENDGKYWVTGRSNFLKDTHQWILARIDKDGIGLDTIFGAGGVSTTVGGEQNIAFEVLQQEDNKIIIGGTHNENHSFDFAVARFIPQLESSIDAQCLKPISISVSPNPTSEMISIEVEDQFGAFNYSISDCSGIIYSKYLTLGSGGKLRVDTRSLMPGMYVLSVWNGNFYGVTKFLRAN